MDLATIVKTKQSWHDSGHSHKQTDWQAGGQCERAYTDDVRLIMVVTNSVAIIWAYAIPARNRW